MLCKNLWHKITFKVLDFMLLFLWGVWEYKSCFLSLICICWGELRWSFEYLGILNPSVEVYLKFNIMVIADIFSFWGFRCIIVQADGWIVEKISLLANPNKVRPKRFWGVYTKLKIFNMTNYKKGKCWISKFWFWFSIEN